MGVESYSISDDTTLYIADSVFELEELACPEHAASLLVLADKGFLIEKTYSCEPTRTQVEEAYSGLSNCLYDALVERGVYTKEQCLSKSHPEAAIPDEIESAFSRENMKNPGVREKTPNFQFLTLALLLSACGQYQT